MDHPRRHHEDERLTQLLIDQAVDGLDAAEADELRKLMAAEASPGDSSGADDFEQAAALTAVALLGRPQALPPHLRSTLIASGRSFTQNTGPASLPFKAPAASSVQATASPRWSMWGGWLAAAACLAIAVLAWLPSAPEIVDPSTARVRLLSQKPADLIQWTWSAGNDAANPNVQGDIVWSDSEQKGYMRFTGLAKNDPTREQYQLWIFDKERKADYPVDGGVFDVNADGEVIVPIDPKLRVFEATMFAVTVEKPGGVARSERERIPVLAQPSA